MGLIEDAPNLPHGKTILSDILAPEDVIYSAFDTEPSKIDTVISVDLYRLFMYFDSHNVNGWKAASASYTVSAGKKLIVLKTWPTGITGLDAQGRKMRLWNVTDSIEVLNPLQFQVAPVPPNAEAGAGLQWGPDLATPGVPVVSEGKTLQLQIWNLDNNQRAIGGAVICREVPA